MYRLNQNVVVAVTLLAAITLTACGGGSSSGGSGGGSSSSSKSSTIVVRSSGLAMSRDPLVQPDGAAHIAAVVSDLFIRHASAASGEVTIIGCEFTTEQTFTPINGEVYIPVGGCPTGYQVCVGEDPTKTCTHVDVSSDMVVYVDVDTGETNSITHEQAAAIPGQPQKVYICHKNNPKPLTVASVSFEKAHLAHGDKLTNSYTGCAQESNTESGIDSQNTNSGNNGNNGKGNENRCNKGNKVKKNCEGINEQV